MSVCTRVSTVLAGKVRRVKTHGNSGAFGFETVLYGGNEESDSFSGSGLSLCQTVHVNSTIYNEMSTSHDDDDSPIFSVHDLFEGGLLHWCHEFVF